MSLSLRNQYMSSTAGPNADAFPNPFLDVASSAVPTSLRNALYWCVLPGALIQLELEEGSQLPKPIEDVVPGDVVLTRGGTYEKVKATSVRPYAGDAVSVEFAGLLEYFPLRVTAEHRLWRMTRLDGEWWDAEKVEAGDLRVGDWVATPLWRDLDEPMCLAYCESVHAKTQECFRDEKEHDWEVAAGNCYSVYENYAHVLYHLNAGFACGVISCPSAFAEGGGASLTVSAASCRKFSDQALEGRLKRDSFVGDEACGIFLRDGYVYRRVTKTTRFKYDGPVYNLEVENDHSFVANGTCISNCEYIFSFNGTYRMANERVISYFLTDIELGDASDEEKEKYTKFTGEILGLYLVEQNLLRDRMCYGNAFASFIVPFRRELGCPKCGSSWALASIYSAPAFSFEWSSDLKFMASCPTCKVGSGFRGEMTIIDRPGDLENKLKVKHWSPHEIEILHDLFSDDTAYLWRIPEEYKAQIRKGTLFHLERVAKPVLDAIRKNQFFRFAPDALFHMKEPTIAGIRNRGWGLPRLLTNFRQVWYVQVLRRMNEAIALDYVIPFRIITPEARARSSGGLSGDPLAMFNGGDAQGQLKRMLRQRRRDPASWHVLPFPVKYNVMGGEANSLAPRDLLDQGNEVLLNDVGIPVELYRGSLQVQSAPPALRLFEATWHHLTHDRNQFLRWVLKQAAQILGWEAVDAKHKRVTIADDVQKQMAFLQLMMGQQLSGTTGMKALGVDWKEEQRLKAEEARTQAEFQARIQEEMQQAGYAQQIAKGQVGGAGGQQGAPQGQGQGQAQDPAQTGQPPAPVDQYLQGMSPEAPRSPVDMMQTADSLAQSLLGQPESAKDSQLRTLKSSDPTMHSLVRSRMDQIRQRSKSNAGQAQGQPPQQGQLPAPG